MCVCVFVHRESEREEEGRKRERGKGGWGKGLREKCVRRDLSSQLEGREMLIARR
jgi:hypothetical protein